MQNKVIASTRTCPTCGRTFLPRNKYNPSTYCSRACSPGAPTKPRIERACAYCGSLMQVKVSKADKRFCSRKCWGLAGRKDRQYLNGYIWMRLSVDVTDFVLEHRHVASQMLGRPLTEDEHVHHVNGIRDDNRPENLRVMSKRDHQLLHREQERSERGWSQNHEACVSCGRTTVKHQCRGLCRACYSIEWRKQNP